MMEDFLITILIYFFLIGIFLFITLLLFLITLKQDKKNATTKPKQEPTSISTPSSSRQFRTFGSRRSRNDKTGIF